MEHLIDLYERALVRQGKSPATVRSYDWALQDLLRYFKALGLADIDRLTRAHLEGWQDALLARGIKPRTRSLASTAVRQFLRFTSAQGYTDYRLAESVEKVKAPRGRPHPIPPADLQKLIAHLHVYRPRMAITDLRDRAIFFYLLTSGARVSEALQVTKADIDHATVIQKGGSEKDLWISPSAVRMVTQYLEARDDGNHWLWVTHDNNRPMRRLDQAGVREIWRRLSRRLGISYFTTHQLRHTCATLMLAGGVNELTAAEHLGHASLATLRNYAEVRDKQRQGAVDVLEGAIQNANRPILLPTIRKGRY